MLPIALLVMSPEQRQFEGRLLVVAVAVVAGLAIWSVARTVSAQRRGAAGAIDADAPGKDALWDHVENTQPVFTGVRAAGFPLAQRMSGPALRDAVLAVTRAIPLDPARSDVYRAAQSAAIAVGLGQPPTLYLANEADMNAVVVGGRDAWSVVLSGGILDSFTEPEMLGLFAALGARVAEGVTDSVTGQVGGEGLMWPSERVDPRQVLQLYQASDSRGVLALRESMPIASALGKTAAGDPYMPGLTIDQAQLMWTWPTSTSPVVATDGDEVVGWLVDLALARGGTLTPRFETLRLDALEAAGAITAEERRVAEEPGRAGV